MKLLVYTDGASRGNPGMSASGFRIYDESHTLLKQGAVYNGTATNNEAEYKAAIAALKAALALGADEIELYSDSKLMVNQLSGNFKVKSGSLKRLNLEAKELLSKFKKRALVNPRRSNEYIRAVDADINALLDYVEEKQKGQ
ncbi:MAG: reverse transcriptase-like protein [Candidatus Micrarchaeaceae archaeon]